VAEEERLLQLAAERHRDAYNRVRANLNARLTAIWSQRGGLTDEALAAFLQTVTPVVNGSTAMVAQSVEAMVRASLTATGEDASAAIVAEALPELRAGVTFDDVYARPFITARTAIAEGLDYTQAMARALTRLRSIGATDVALAQRSAMERLLVKVPAVQGFRRTLTGRSCLFCATASTRRYTQPGLMPVHAHCDCGVSPIIGTRDPGATINRQVLRNLKASGGPEDYWKRQGWVDEEGNVLDPAAAEAKHLSQTAEHGELGATCRGATSTDDAREVINHG